MAYVTYDGKFPLFSSFKLTISTDNYTLDTEEVDNGKCGDKQLTKIQCKDYANSKFKSFSDNVFLNYASGCVEKNNEVYFNYKTTSHDCNTDGAVCICKKGMFNRCRGVMCLLRCNRKAEEEISIGYLEL